MVGLGSNVGPRAAHLAAARLGLAAGGFGWTLASSIWETAPVGGPPGQRPYLNQVLAAPSAAVEIGPRALLELCREVEARAGRRRGVRWGPRTLDADVLLWGSRVLETESLTVPHPRLSERSFVLGPLTEMIPGVVEPRTGLTAAALWARLGRPAPSCPPARGPRTMPSSRP